MTHDEVTERAERWLRNTKRCGVVLTEFGSSSPEIPDAIGWAWGGRWSYLVECKTSKSDFYADKKKPGRCGLRAHHGIGRERYYMAPKGVLSAELVRKHRPGWGLLEICGRRVRVVVKAIPFDHATRLKEMPLLYAYVRRVFQYGVPLLEVQALCRDEADKRRAEV
jgi:hypothetical protein